MDTTVKFGRHIGCNRTPELHYGKILFMKQGVLPSAGWHQPQN